MAHIIRGSWTLWRGGIFSTHSAVALSPPSFAYCTGFGSANLIHNFPFIYVLCCLFLPWYLLFAQAWLQCCITSVSCWTFGSLSMTQYIPIPPSVQILSFLKQSKKWRQEWQLVSLGFKGADGGTQHTYKYWYRRLNGGWSSRNVCPCVRCIK